MTPVGSSGDVHPFIGIGRQLRARGHEVVIVTAAPFAGAVRAAGLEFAPFGTTEEFDAVTRHRDLWHPRRGLTLVFAGVAARLRQAYAGLEQLYVPGRSVLVGHSLSFATRVFEETHGVPAATLHLAPSIFRSEVAPAAFAPGHDAARWPAWIKRAAWWAIDLFLLDPPVVPTLNAWRRELGLPPVAHPFRDWLHSPQRVIGLFPDWFGAPQPDWPAAVRLTGFPLYDESDQAGVPASLERFLDAGPPPLVFTPGSANQAASRFFAAAVDASRRLGRRALLLTRYADHLPATLPPGVHHEPFVPLSQALPRCAALVSHGGIGTLAQGLAAGVPQLTMPMGFDQPDNVTRLSRLHVGTWVTPSRFDGPRVATALDRLLGSADTAAACRQWAERMRASRAVEATCDLLEQLA